MTVKWNDLGNFISKLSIEKVWNATQVFSSYQYSRLTKKPVQWGLPFHLSVEPTTSCNLRCPECPSGLRSFTRPTGMLETELYRNLVDEIGDKLIYLYFYFQGEPYLHPEFTDLVSYASKKGVYSVTSTNAHYLNDDNAQKTIESGLDRMIISIDGTTQETYESYRVGGSLEKVIKGAETMVKWREKLGAKKPHLIFQFLVVKPNEHQIEEVHRLAREIGVDEVLLKTAQIYDYESGSDLIPTQDQYSRYAQQPDGSYTIKNELLNHCWKLWHSCVVTWDGDIVPCCFDKDAAHKKGSLQNFTFREIWQNESYQAFRASILKSRKEIDICQNCTEGLTVWANKT